MDGTQVCTRCREEKPVSEYYRSTTCVRGTFAYCKKCSIAAGKRNWAERCAEIPTDPVVAAIYGTRTAPGAPTLSDMCRAARAKGHRRFDPGIACVNGHASLRTVDGRTGVCVECHHIWRTSPHAKAVARAYWNDWPHARAIAARYRARKFAAAIGDRKAYRVFVRWAQRTPSIPCAWCRAETLPGGRHIDHIIPLSRGGADAVENLCVACPPCNMSKGSKLPSEFRRAD